MRPRVFPAEDWVRRPECTPCWSRFNEAAGIPRGRRVSGRAGGGGRRRFNEAAGIPRGRRDGRRWENDEARASMRPRVFPAEDPTHAIIAAWDAPLQ